VSADLLRPDAPLRVPSSSVSGAPAFALMNSPLLLFRRLLDSVWIGDESIAFFVYPESGFGGACWGREHAACSPA
jgi:hypothetical protein